MAKLGIKIDTQDAGLTKLIEGINKIIALGHGPLPETFQTAAAKIVSSTSQSGEKTAEIHKQTAAKVKETVLAGVDVEQEAAKIKERAEREYTELKHEYVLKGLDATRQAIHEEEQAVKASRDAIAKAVREGATKETQAVLKGERDKQNARLQGLRSVEKEITGARTFTEQLEKNVYEPVNEQAKKGGALSLLLFGEVGALKKQAEKAEATAKEFEEKVKSEAEAAKAKIESLEQEHAAKIKEIDSQLTAAKSEAEKKELEATKASIAAQIEQEVHLTKEKQAQEQIQLTQHAEMLKKEAAASKAEAEKEAAKPKGKEGGGGMGLIGGLIGGAGIMGAVEGLKTLTEKAKEAQDAEEGLRMGTGLAGEQLKKQSEDAEKLGDKYAISGDAAKGMEGTISAMTHATGDALNKQTEAVLAYAMVHKRANQTVEEAASKVMKQYGTNATLRAQIDAESALNQKKAMAAMNDPAMQEKKAMAEVTTAVGQLASMIMGALGPVLKAVSPVITTLSSTLGAILKPILDSLTPIIADVSGAMTDMLPPVMELVKAVLGLLEPVLIPFKAVFHAILPVLETVVKQISTALAPVFKALTPILSEVAGLIGDLASAGIKTLLVPTLNILLPILTELLVPVLQSLMPLLKMIADILSAVLTPTLRIFGNIMNWIVTNAIQPVVQWLTGALSQAIESTVGQITKAVGAITSVVSSVTSFLGLGDKAADATKDAGKKVLAAQAETNQQSIDQTKTMSLTEESELRQRITDHVATIGELKAAELKAEQSGNQTFADYLKHQEAALEKQHKSAGAAGAKIAKQAAKDKFEVERGAADDELALAKDNIILLGETNKKAKADETQAEITHAQELLAIAKEQYGEKSKQYIGAKAKLKSLQQQSQQDERAATIEAMQNQTNTELSELSNRALRENMTAKQTEEAKYKLEVKAMQDEIALRKSWGEDVSKLQMQLDATTLKHDSDLNKQRLALSEEVSALVIQNEKNEINQRIAQKKALGQSTEKEEAELTKIEEDAEDARYAKELAARKDDLADAKNGAALKEQLEIQHQNNVDAIENAAYQRRLAGNQAFAASMGNLILSDQKNRLDMLSQFGQKQFGIQGIQFLQQKGGVVKFLEQNLLLLAQNYGAQVATTIMGENAKTAAVNTGSIARMAQLAAEGIASAASAVGTWVAVAAKAVYNAFEVLPFPVDIVAAAASVAAVYELSTKVAGMFKPKKLAEGAVLTQPTFAVGFEAGEAGHEAAIPLNRYRGMRDIMDGGIADGIRQLNVTMANVHNAVSRQPAPAVLPPYASKVWQGQETRQINQRKLGV